MVISLRNYDWCFKDRKAYTIFIFLPQTMVLLIDSKLRFTGFVSHLSMSWTYFVLYRDCLLSAKKPSGCTIYCEKPYYFLIGMILFKFISWQISKLPPSSISWFVQLTLWTHTDTELMLKLFWYWRYRKHNNSDDGCHAFILFTI